MLSYQHGICLPFRIWLCENVFRPSDNLQWCIMSNASTCSSSLGSSARALSPLRTAPNLVFSWFPLTNYIVAAVVVIIRSMHMIFFFFFDFFVRWFEFRLLLIISFAFSFFSSCILNYVYVDVFYYCLDIFLYILFHVLLIMRKKSFY